MSDEINRLSESLTSEHRKINQTFFREHHDKAVQKLRVALGEFLVVHAQIHGDRFDIHGALKAGAGIRNESKTELMALVDISKQLAKHKASMIE